MSLSRMLVRAAVVAASAAALQACAGPYGPHGDKGLPPPPENLAYPTVYQTGPDNHHKLKSAADQKQLQGELLAHKPQGGARTKRSHK